MVVDVSAAVDDAFRQAAKGTKGSSGTCYLCRNPVYERAGGLTVGTSGSDIDELLRQAAARKFVCPSCTAVFCLSCGNAKGQALGTGSTHCPKCGTQVL